MSSQLILESPPTQQGFNDQAKVSPSNFNTDHQPLLSLPQQQKVQSKLSEADLATYIKAKTCQKYAADQIVQPADENIVEASVAEENHSSSSDDDCCSAADENDEILQAASTSPKTLKQNDSLFNGGSQELQMGSSRDCQLQRGSKLQQLLSLN